MEYADLRVLEAVARHGSMNRATAELHTVQPNVSARICVSGGIRPMSSKRRGF